jgi:hypothetical protein
MNTRNISRLALLLTLALAGNAGAASLVLKPAPGMLVAGDAIQIGQGGTINLDLQLVLDEGEALPGAYGGAIAVSYDSRQFDFAGFAPNGVTYFCQDPQPPGGCAPVVTTTGFAETVQFGFDYANNTDVVGTFSFIANGGIGSIATLGLADEDDFFGTFFRYEPTYQPMELQFSGASVAVVPLPASVWLLGSAIGALAARRRLRRNAG